MNYCVIRIEATVCVDNILFNLKARAGLVYRGPRPKTNDYRNNNKQ